MQVTLLPFIIGYKYRSGVIFFHRVFTPC